MAKRRSHINGGFIVQPKRTLKSKQWKELKLSSREVYRALLTEFVRDKKLNPDNKVKMTQLQIEELTGISHKTVVTAIRELKEAELLFIDKQGCLGKQSEYKLNGRYLY